MKVYDAYFEHMYNIAKDMTSREASELLNIVKFIDIKDVVKHAMPRLNLFPPGRGLPAVTKCLEYLISLNLDEPDVKNMLKTAIDYFDKTRNDRFGIMSERELFFKSGNELLAISAIGVALKLKMYEFIINTSTDI